MVLELLRDAITWWTVWPQVIRALVFFVFPGYLLVWPVIDSMWWRVFAAPLAISALAPLLAVIFPFIGVAYTPLTVLASAVVISLLMAVSKWVMSRVIDESKFHERAELSQPSLAGLGYASLVAIFFGAIPVAFGMSGGPGMPPQTYDAVYHLNAVRTIIDRADGSCLHLVEYMNPGRLGGFYPAGWHDAVALIAGSDVVRGTNLMVILGVVIAAIYAGMVVALIFPDRVFAAPFGALAASMFVAFPARLVSYGTVWPTFWSYIWVAAFLVVLTQLWRIWGQERITKRLESYSLIVLTVIAAALAQPSAVFAQIYLSLAVVIIILGARLFGQLPGITRIETVLLITGLAVAILGIVLISFTSLFQAVSHYSNPVESSPFWAPITALTGAQLFNQGYGSPSGSLGLAVLGIAGIVFAVRKHHSWLVGSWLIFVSLFTISLTHSPLSALCGPWYSNSVRIGGLIPLVAAPLVGVALVSITIFLLKTEFVIRKGTAVVVCVAVGATAFLGTDFSRVKERAAMVYINYHARDNSGLNGMVSRDEVQMLRTLGNALPTGAKIVGSPMSGAALAYALGGVQVMFPAISVTVNKDAEKVGIQLMRIGEDQQICESLQRQHARYVYWDPIQYWPENSEWNKYRGIQELDPRSRHWRVVATGGTAGVYEVPESVCRISDASAGLK